MMSPHPVVKLLCVIVAAGVVTLTVKGAAAGNTVLTSEEGSRLVVHDIARSWAGGCDPVRLVQTDYAWFCIAPGMPNSKGSTDIAETAVRIVFQNVQRDGYVSAR